MIAPIRAMPIEPPTWREALRTAEPTPDLSTGSARTAAAALGDAAFVRRSHELNLAGMQQLTAGFGRLGLAWIPSSGNFVSVAIPRASGQSRAGAVFEGLLRQGVIVRPVGGYGMPDHLRVTVGLPQENERFLAALATALR